MGSMKNNKYRTSSEGIYMYNVFVRDACEEYKLRESWNVYDIFEIIPCNDFPSCDRIVLSVRIKPNTYVTHKQLMSDIIEVISMCPVTFKRFYSGISVDELVCMRKGDFHAVTRNRFLEELICRVISSVQNITALSDELFELAKSGNQSVRDKVELLCSI